MKRLLVMMAMVAACCFGQAQNDVSVNVKVNLADGSQLQGTLHTSSLALVTSFGKKEIPLAQIASLDFAKDGVKVNFRNRDVLSGTLEGSAFVLRTIFNDVKLDSSQVKSIQFLRAGNALWGNEPGLLLHVLLDSPSENLGVFNAHMEITNARMIEGPSGGDALLLDSEDAKTVIHLPFSPYVIPEGTIEFWAKFPNPHQHFGGGGGQPWFFYIERDEDNDEIRAFMLFGFTANDGTGKSGLVGGIRGLVHLGTHAFGAVSSVAGSGLLGDTPDGWHHYAFIWKWDGLEFAETHGKIVLLTVDGRLVASAVKGPTDKRYEIVRTIETKCRLLIHDYNSDCSRPIAMSNLKMWNYAKSPEQLEWREVR